MASLPTVERGAVTVVVPMPPSYRGGTEEYAYQVARFCSEARPVHILTTSARWNDGKNALSVGSASLDVIPAREILERPLVVGPAAARRLKAAIARSSVVHLHMPFPWVERRVLAWADRAKVPTVLTYHMDAEFGRDPNRMGSRLITGGYRRLSALPALARCRAVVSNSLGYARASPVLSRFLPKVRVIYQGIDVDRLRAGSAPPDAIPPRTPGKKRILFIGRLVPYKGLPDLLRAVAKLTQGGQPVELLIGGRGPQLDELRALAAGLGLDGTVRFLGFVPDAAVGALYADADVVACPSVSLLESTPITLQEAMAFGTPVVGTTLPGTEETVPDDGRRGRLVQPHDVDALARALGELIERGRPGEAPPARTWQDTARDYLKLYDEIAAGSPAG